MGSKVEMKAHHDPVTWLEASKTVPNVLFKNEDPGTYVIVETVTAYILAFLIGYLREIYDFFRPTNLRRRIFARKGADRFSSFTNGFNGVFMKHLFMKCSDSFGRVSTGKIGKTITILDREVVGEDGNFVYTGKKIECLNLGSYNYLGFSHNTGPITEQVEQTVRDKGISISSSPSDSGTSTLLLETEALTAQFLGTESAMIIGTGFATNSTTLPILLGPGCLAYSDTLNHSSLITGIRLSGATVRVFKHRSMKHLEALLKRDIVNGQPKTGLPWKKIYVIVEGLYSMEGTICPLLQYLELKEKYKFYLYIDEAHSIGALGPNGKGLCDYFGVSPRKVDILMGTFTKSFGSIGGYISGSKELVDYVRSRCHSSIYGESMSYPAIQQINSTIKVIMSQSGDGIGRKAIERLERNSKYFSRRLRDLGFIIYGDYGSPVVPLIVYHPKKIAKFSRRMLARKIAIVVVGYPATPLISCRVRFCISAVHEIHELDRAIECIKEIGGDLGLRFLR